MMIIQNLSIRFIYPLYFKGFPQPDPLYHHFRKQQQCDNIYTGLAIRASNYFRFIISYRASVRTSMTARDIPRDSECFSTAFIVEYYGEDT